MILQLVEQVVQSMLLEVQKLLLVQDLAQLEMVLVQKQVLVRQVLQVQAGIVRLVREVRKEPIHTKVITNQGKEI